MAPKIKNIILFSGIAISLVLAYIFLIKPSPEGDNLTSSSESSVPSSVNTDSMEKINQNSMVTKEFLTVLLNVKGLKLDDSIFSDKAFLSLHDSSILLVPTGDEGRVNPFAPIGSDSYVNSSIFSAPIPFTTETPATTPQ